MLTYFISDGTLVKIGRSLHPAERIAQLQTSSSKKLELLVTMRGDLEMAFHKLFADLREGGEWFRREDQLNYFLKLPNDNARTAFFARECEGLTGELRLVTQDGHENLLLCPYCNDTLNIYQHVGHPEESVHENGDPVLRIPIWGECGHRWSFYFHHHAGHTFLGVGPASSNDSDPQGDYERETSA